jgi:tRNA nucleotidyltransferase (CCA-adding enzyme)
MNLEKEAKNIIVSLNSQIKKFKIKAQVFIGGSFAKNTLIKKNKYDVDIFLRFNSDYDEKEISALLGKIVPRNALKIHGSRDYFVIKNKQNNFEFEIIPTMKINKPESAKNITDLSYFHVNYVLNKIKKDKKLTDEIRIAKAFVHYSDCYGAESYINGFSGYAVELLVIHYKSFLNFIKAVAEHDNSGKIILDPSKLFKNKQDILRKMNESKLQSPIILIDPTFKERNALAALSDSTFSKFQDFCRKFLKNPSNKFFVKDNKEEKFRQNNKNLFEIVFKTDRQAGDIAGTKLKKFSGFFIQELSRFFEVKDWLLIYEENKNIGKILVGVHKRDKVEFRGPPLEMKQQLALFKKEHKKIIFKKNIAWAYEKNFKDFSEFLRFFKNKNSEITESMGISFL